MIKSVLLSIRPEWCKKILGGEKTTEIRKSRPNLETPFRCYIYCAMPVGNVIGEFTCDRIRFYSGKSWLVKEDVESVTAGSCLSLEQVKEYAGWRKAASFMDRKDVCKYHALRTQTHGRKAPPEYRKPKCLLFDCWLEQPYKKCEACRKACEEGEHDER